MKKMLGALVVLTLMVFVGTSMAKVHAGRHARGTAATTAATPLPLPGCTVEMVEAGVPACDPQGPEIGGGDDVDAADCSVEGECQGTPTGNPEGEGAYDAGGDDANSPPDHG
jgi:hypothetical protein